MAVIASGPKWVCRECGSHDGFTATIDRIVHVTNNHIGVVVAPDSEEIMQNIQFDPVKKVWS